MHLSQLVFIMQARYLFILILLCHSTLAQDTQKDTDEKKKPSWSLGLPERTSKPQVNKPSLTTNNTEDRAKERPDFGFDESDVTVDGFQPEIDLVPTTSERSSEVNEDIEPVETLPEIEVDSGQARVQAEQKNSTSEGLDTYAWNIIQSEVITIPKTLYFSKKQVRLRVTINPSGEVVKVKGIRNTTPHSVLNYVKQALKSWRFEAPEKFGVTKNLTKELIIPLSLR